MHITQILLLGIKFEKPKLRTVLISARKAEDKNVVVSEEKKIRHVWRLENVVKSSSD